MKADGTVTASLADFLLEKIDEYFLEKRKRYPAHTNWASNLGHPCLRYLVHARLDWDKKELPDIGLQKIFYEGNIQEEAVLRLFDEIGIRILRTQEPFFWKEYEISGRIDGVIQFENDNYPVEIKSLSPWNYDSINGPNDMKTHDHYYIRGYLTQMAIYQLHTNSEKGLFILKNKTSGQIKIFEVPLDYDLAEEALKKAEMVNEYVKKGEYPERMEYDPNICDSCPFQTICLPEKKAMSEAEIIETERFHRLLDARERLKAFYSKYEKIYKKIDSHIKEVLAQTGKDKVLAGDWLITGKKISVKEKVVPAYTYTRWTFKKLKKEGS